MSATASWLRRHWVELGWAAFSAANIAVMWMLAGVDGGTVPFHFIWVSLTILYGFTVWRVWPTTAVVLTVVMLSTAAMIMHEVVQGPTRPDELTEVPLMAAMFCAMVWHARRRAVAEVEAIQSREREREFIRDSSHHLKTPLALAHGYAELVRSSSLGPTESKDVESLLVELDRLAKIVEGLLLFMSADRPQGIDRRSVDLEQLLLRVTARWMDAVDRNWDMDVGEAGKLLADATQLECAFDALIENAVEATEPHDRITVDAFRENEDVVIRFVDNGEGIPRESIDHVFERFWSESRRRQRRGTGLGLAIVRAIVDAHGGTITVRSGSGETVFLMRLPHGLQAEIRPAALPTATEPEVAPLSAI